MKSSPDDTWPCPAPSVLPRDGETMPSLDVLLERAFFLDSDELEDDAP